MDGYFAEANKACSVCLKKCATCSNTSDNCNTCADTVSRDPSLNCICRNGFYEMG